MPFNGLGLFQRLYSWTADAANPATDFIRADKMDNEMNGFATGLSNCITRDGEAPPTANIPMGNFRFTGLSPGVASGDSLTYGQVFGTAATFTNATLITPNIQGATFTGAINAMNVTQFTVPTPFPGDDSNSIATTAFVNAAVFELVVPAWFQQFVYQLNGII